MLKKVINPTLFLPLALFINTLEVLPNEKKDFIDKIIEEKSNNTYVSYQEIEKIVINNEELKSLQNLVTSAGFNLSSKIGQRYPSLDFQANGLPKYVLGKQYSSNSETLKTSQFTANPSLNIKWDLIDPLRGSDIKIAKENFKIAENNYEIKKKDLIQEARMRYHKYQKSYQDIQNQKYILDLSITSLNNAKAKLDAGIGTKFEVLEAEAQLARDKQSLNEKKIEHEINKISLKEILNIKEDFIIDKEQKLSGFWDYKLNKNLNTGLAKNLSLENLSLQKKVRNNQAISFLNAQRPIVYISNTFSSSFTKGEASSLSIDPGETASSYTNTIGLNFAWNVFDGGQNKNSYKATKAQEKSEVYSYNNLRNILQTNIRKAYLNLKLNEKKILSSLKEVSSTKESLRLARLRYDAGISTMKDVLVRQKELSDAKSNQINAIYNYNLNLDELERLTFLEISKNCLDNNNNKSNAKESICNIPQ